MSGLAWRSTAAGFTVVVATATGVVINLLTDAWDVTLAVTLAVLVGVGAALQVALTTGQASQSENRTPPVEGSPRASGSAVSVDVWNLPLRRVDFAGRLRELTKVSEALEDPSEVRFIVLYGMGGVGKTTLAVHYCYAAASRPAVGWLVTATNRESTIRGLALLASRLGVGERDHETAASRALDELGNRDGWFLVYDNAADPGSVEGLLPARGCGRVVITSRNPNWHGLGTTLEIEPFQRNEAVSYLLRNVGRPPEDDDHRAAEALATEIRGLPLALDVVAAYCRNKGLTLGEYGRLKRTQRLQAAEGAINDNLLRSFDDVSYRRPDAAQLLRTLVMLAPTGIPRDLITARQTSLPRGVRRAAADIIRLNELYGVLLQTSLVRPSLAGQVQIHELILEAIRSRIRTETHTWIRRLVDRLRALVNCFRYGHLDHTSAWTEEKWLQIAAELVVAAFPVGGHTVDRWDRCSLLLPHALEIIERSSSSVGRPTIAELLYRVGRYLHDRGDFQNARQCFERSVSIWESDVGWRDARYVRVADSLAMTLRAMGDVDGALELHRRVLQARRETLGSEAQETLYTANKLAMALRTRAETTLSKFARLYEDDADTWAPTSGQTEMEAVSSAVAILRMSRNLQSAWELANTTLLSNSTAAGLLARGISAQAMLDLLGSATADLNEARSLQEHSFTTYRRTIGVAEPDTLYAANNLATTLRVCGELQGALELAETTLAAYEKTLGSEHPDTIKVLNNLALIVRGLGDLDRALNLNVTTLRLRSKVLGREHPDTLRSANNTAVTMAAMGHVVQAAELHRKTLDARRRVLGEVHPETRVSKENLASLRKRMEASRSIREIHP